MKGILARIAGKCAGSARLFLTGALVASAVLAVRPAVAADWASVMMYHRFGENKYPQTNIRIEQFQAHIDELKNGGYSVWPLGKIVDYLASGTPLPDKTVAITVDDAYKSVYENAFPMLKEAGFPFTVFVATNNVDRRLPDYMTWDQIREIVAGGGYIGHHTASHAHLPALGEDRIRQEIATASDRFQAELGFVPGIFAYPYGEYGADIKRLVAEAGFKAAFGQQSGVAYSGHDRYSLPRFAMNENYGAIGRLRLAANAMPLRVRNVTPSDNILDRNPPAFGFSLDEDYPNAKQLACYASNQTGGAVPIEWIGERRVEIRLNTAFNPGRGRINCTLPGPEGRFRWFGNLFYIPGR
ncbi:polysaccharide deacetylase [Sneathiella chinensis]|uniref:Chitooligosaccharide deacetylase n=2 Tax=Sneathiella chinensis TaxID=349750 RepID=A0ABQ5U1P5_9PROT|nr:polysaccharide deacetylase [Sneathiella chinensis]